MDRVNHAVISQKGNNVPMDKTLAVHYFKLTADQDEKKSNSILARWGGGRRSCNSLFQARY
jgi:hypothetical protein